MDAIEHDNESDTASETSSLYDNPPRRAALPSERIVIEPEQDHIEN